MSGPTTRDFAKATYAGTAAVGRVLRPAAASEVPGIVRAAARSGRRLHPISTGRNWGYGSATPPVDADLLDLGALTSILGYDREIGTVVVEPGVTQGRLADFLREEGDLHWMDPAGAARDVSIVGNTLERGFGHTAYADHWQNVMWIEAVLADGRTVRTGFAGHRGALAADAFRWGAGPVLDGLFSQSGLGVVTKMAIALMPRPEAFCAVFAAGRDDGSLAPIVDAVRVARQRQLLRSAAHIVNDYKVFQSFGPYPWDRMDGAVPLSRDVRLALRAEWGVSAWNLSGALYGTRRQVAEAKAHLRRALRPHCGRIAFVSRGKADLAKRLGGALSRAGLSTFAETVERLDPVLDLMTGQPTDGVLASTYWRKRAPVPSAPDPDRDRCGLIWIPPVAPLVGRHAQAMGALVEDGFGRHGFEPAMSMTAITERALDNVVCLSFDRDVPGEDDRALACFEETTQALADQGYFPYRTHPTGFDHRPWRDEHLLDTIRTALDPEGVFARRDPPARAQADRAASGIGGPPDDARPDRERALLP